MTHILTNCCDHIAILTFQFFNHSTFFFSLLKTYSMASEASTHPRGQLRKSRSMLFSKHVIKLIILDEYKNIIFQLELCLKIPHIMSKWIPQRQWLRFKQMSPHACMRQGARGRCQRLPCPLMMALVWVFPSLSCPPCVSMLSTP